MFCRPGNDAFLSILSMLLTVSLVFAVPFSARSAENSEPASRDRRADRERSRTKMILGVSWQPGFCETRPKTPECSGQTAERTDARLFSLNGLWKYRKTYCGVDGALKEQDKNRKWLDMPELSLDEGGSWNWRGPCRASLPVSTGTSGSSTGHAPALSPTNIIAGRWACWPRSTTPKCRRCSRRISAAR